MEGVNCDENCLINTLLAYMVQLIISSESMLPSNPKSAPEAPTDIFDLINRAENKLPPSPAMI